MPEDPFQLTLANIKRMREERLANPVPRAPRFVYAKKRDERVPGSVVMHFIELNAQTEDVPTLEEEVHPFDVDQACADALKRVQAHIEHRANGARALAHFECHDALVRLGIKD